MSIISMGQTFPAVDFSLDLQIDCLALMHFRTWTLTLTQCESALAPIVLHVLYIYYQGRWNRGAPNIFDEGANANGIEDSVYRLRISKMWCFCSLFIIHYLNQIHYLVRKVSSGAHQYLSNVQKANKTASNHGLKTTQLYAHRYHCFGNFQMIFNKWRPIIADAVDHVSKTWLLKSVYTLCKWCK